MNLASVKLFRFVEVFARILCAKSGVSILFSGTTASTNGKIIYLPAFSKVLDDLVLAKALYLGFVVHEAFHVLWTDFEIFIAYVTKFPVRQSAVNILEDVRIEYRGALWVVGFKKTLATLTKALVGKEDFFGTPTADLSAVCVCNMHLLYSLRFSVLGQTAFSTLAADARLCLEAKIGEDNVSKIDLLVSNVVECTSTADVCALVDELFVLLDQIAEECPPLDSPADEQGHGSDDGTEDKTEEGSSGLSNDDDEHDQSNDQHSSSSVDAAEDTGSSESDPSESQNSSSSPDDQNIDQGSGEDFQGSRQWGICPDGTMDPSCQDKWDLGDITSSAINGDELAQNEVKESMTPVDHYLGCVFGPCPTTRTGHERDMPAISHARALTNSLSFQLRSLLESKKSVHRGRRDTGLRISQSSLARVAIGDVRVFQKNSRVTGTNTVVYIVMDVSTSMDDNTIANVRSSPTKIQVARESVLALSLALDTISDVKVGVMAYPQQYFNSSKDTNEQYMVDLVEVGESVQLRSKAIMSIQASGSTPTAEAVLYARSKMDTVAAERRVVLVITDGEPDDENRLVEVLSEVGVDTDIIGIGIGTNSVQKTFKNHVVINSAQDLTNVAFRKIKEVLLFA